MEWGSWRPLSVPAPSGKGILGRLLWGAAQVHPGVRAWKAPRVREDGGGAVWLQFWPRLVKGAGGPPAPCRFCSVVHEHGHTPLGGQVGVVAGNEGLRLNLNFRKITRTFGYRISMSQELRGVYLH